MKLLCSSLLFLLSVPTVTAGLFDQPVFPWLQCYARMYFLGFDIGEFDSYGTYFRDDSVMTLAETGAYTGADAIEEYVKFVFAEFSPYYATAERLDEVLTYRGFENGNCVFTTTYDVDYTMNGDVTRGADQYRSVHMVKLSYNYKDKYIKAIDVFYTKSYIQALFGEMLHSDNTRQYVCDTIEGPCNGYISEPPADCLATLASLPAATGDTTHADGDSQGCRALHAVFASTNPMHCAHIATQPQEDGNGKVKCQTSASMEPQALFDDSDLELFREYCGGRGLDPDTCHTVVLQ